MITNYDDAIMFSKDYIKSRKIKESKKIINILKDYGYSDSYFIPTLFLDVDKNIIDILEKNKAFDKKIISAIKILNKREKINEDEYLLELSKSRIAKVIESAIRFDFLKRRLNYEILPDNIESYIKSFKKNYIDFIKQPDVKKQIQSVLDKYKQRFKDDYNGKEVEDTVKSLCNKYNFTYQTISNVIFISSKFDKWRVDCKTDFSGFKLYHCNKRHSLKDYHFQRKFEGKHAKVEEIIAYIKKHDEYVLNHKYNYDKIDKLLAQVQKK